MSAEPQRAEWLEAGFWERLDRLEGRHQQTQWELKSAGRALEQITRLQSEELHLAWQRYCEVIVALDRASADIEALLACAS